MQVSEEYQLPIPKDAFEYLVENESVKPMPEGCTVVQEGMKLFIEMEINNGETQIFKDRVKAWLDNLIMVYGQKHELIALNQEIEALHSRLKAVEGALIIHKWLKPLDMK